MQAQIAVEQNDWVIRLPKQVISQEALASLLQFIELTALQDKTQQSATTKFVYRKPPAELAGKMKILGDIIAPVI